jgi:hypothetical protein
MAESETTTSSAPAATPTKVCVTAHRLEDNRVLVSAEDHELHALEGEMQALETTARDAALTTDEEAPAHV